MTQGQHGRFGFDPLTTDALSQMYAGRPPAPRPTTLARWLLGLLGVALLAAGTGLWLDQPSTARPIRIVHPAADSGVTPALQVPVSSLQALSRHAAPGQPPPTRIQISRIGVDASISRLDLNPDSTIQTPQDPAVTGWFEGGPAPGEPGPAVILGHVDSNLGPAVFWRLDQLQPGDSVTVTRARGGGAVGFAVQHVARYPRAAFPSAEVYGPTRNPELRLITCGGYFDLATRQYSDNVVVFATLVS